MLSSIPNKGFSDQCPMIYFNQNFHHDFAMSSSYLTILGPEINIINLISMSQYNMSLVMRKPALCICEKQRRRSTMLKLKGRLINAFVFSLQKNSIVSVYSALAPESDISRLQLTSVAEQRGRKLGRLAFMWRGSYMSLVVRKPVFGVSDQVRHKLGCTATEDD